MSFRYSPKIITDGLILCLDAANPKSYPGSGTIWYDLSGNDNHGTLSHEAIGTTESNTMTFNGTSNYILINNNNSLNITNELTILCWSNLINDPSNNHFGLISKGSYVQYQLKYDNALKVVASLRHSGGRSDYNYSSGNSMILNTWNFSSIVYDGTSTVTSYLNSTSVSQTKSLGAIVTTDDPLYIGGNFGYWWSGYISVAQIYNRALTSIEILQNYNSLKGRFNLI